MNKEYIQCSVKQGSNEYVVYIQASAAIIGNKLELKNKPGIWEIIGTYPNGQIKMYSWDVFDGNWEAEPKSRCGCCCECSCFM